MNSTTETDNPTLIIIRGVPGSGKSYLATALSQSIGADNVVVVDPDKIDQTSKEYIELSESLTVEGVDTKFHPYRFLRSKAYDAITAHKIIIWNQAFNDFKGFEITVNRLKEFASGHDIQLPVLVVEVELSPDAAKKRIAKRVKKGGHDVSDAAFAGFVSQYESFAGKGYETIVVNGENDVSESVASVTKALADK